MSMPARPPPQTNSQTAATHEYRLWRTRVVPAERLAEDLWGALPPPGAAGTLRSRPRTLVGPDAALIARGGGYALAAGPEQLGAGRFERL
jgi:DNA-binding SARP family transcriptional activator